MTFIPRPRTPEEPTPPFDFAQWDAEQFRRAGELLTSLAQRHEAVTSARRAVLALYFADLSLTETQTETQS